jgi:hypothetical protein
VARIKPVEQSGARAADVEIAGGRWGKSNARFHRRNLTTTCRVEAKRKQDENESTRKKAGGHLPAGF